MSALNSSNTKTKGVLADPITIFFCVNGFNDSVTLQGIRAYLFVNNALYKMLYK